MCIFRKAANFLKKNAGVTYPIKIRRIKLSDELDGDCRFCEDGYFLIRINKKLSPKHSIDVAIHEVSHAMSWDKEKDIHGAAWGIAYSKLYRKFLEFEYYEEDEQEE